MRWTSYSSRFIGSVGPYAGFAHFKRCGNNKRWKRDWEFVPTFCRINGRNWKSGNEHVPFSPRCRSQILPCIISGDWGYVDIRSLWEAYIWRRPYGRFLHVQQQQTAHPDDLGARFVQFFFLSFQRGFLIFIFRVGFKSISLENFVVPQTDGWVLCLNGIFGTDRPIVGWWFLFYWGMERCIAISGRWMCDDRSLGSTVNVDQKECRLGCVMCNES